MGTGSLFIWVIGLSLLGITFWIWTLLGTLQRRFSAEQAALAATEQVFERFDAQTDPDEVLRAAKDSPGLAATLVEGAYRTRELPNASMEPLLSPLVEETTSWLTPLRGSSNLLMLLGLIATLVGLTLTISSLRLDGVDAETLSGALPEALSHMGTAFVGSLAGVFGAVVLNWKVTACVRQQQQLVRQVASFAFTVVAPIMIRPRMDAQVEQLTRAITDSSEMYKQVRQGIDESTDKFGELLERAGTIIAGQLTQLQESAKEVYGTLEKVSGDVKTSADALQDSSRDLNIYHGELRNAHTELEKMFKRSQDDLDRRSDELLSRMNEMQAEYGQSAQHILGGVLTAVTRLDGVHDQIGKATERFEQGGEQIVGSVGSAFSNLHGMLDATLSEHKREMTTVSDKLNAFTQSLTQIVDVNRDLQRISEGVQLAENQRAAAVVTAMETTQKSVSGSVQNLVQGMLDQHTSFRDATSHLSERVGLEIGRVTETLLAQPEQFTALLYAHREQTEELQISLAEAFQHAIEALGSQVREQPNVIRALLADAAAAQRQAAAEQGLETHKQLGELGAHTRELLQQTVAEQGEQLRSLVSDQQAGVKSQLGELGELFSSSSGRFESLLHEQQTLQMTSHQKLQDYVGALASDLANQPRHFEALLGEQNTTNTQLADLLAQQAQQAQESLERQTSAQVQLLQDLSRQLEPLTVALGAQPQQFEALLKTQSAAAAQVGETAAQHLVSVRELLAQQVSQAGESLERQTSAQLQLLQDLSRQLEPLTAALGAHPQQFETLLKTQNAVSAQVSETAAQQLVAVQALLTRQVEQVQHLLDQSSLQVAAHLASRLEQVFGAHQSALEQLQLPSLTPVVSGLQRVEDQLGQGVLRLEQTFNRHLTAGPPRPEPQESGAV